MYRKLYNNVKFAPETLPQIYYKVGIYYVEEKFNWWFRRSILEMKGIWSRRLFSIVIFYPFLLYLEFYFYFFVLIFLMRNMLINNWIFMNRIWVSGQWLWASAADANAIISYCWRRSNNGIWKLQRSCQSSCIHCNLLIFTYNGISGNIVRGIEGLL